MNIKKLRLNNGKTVEQVFRAEVRRFKAILQDEINKWYSSYNPSYYERTKWFKSAINHADFIDVLVDNDKLTAAVSFDNNKIESDGYWGEGTVNLLEILNYGYQVKKPVWFKNVYRFGFYEGGHFIESAIKRFNKQNKLGIKITVNRKEE